jgi:RNA polymerase sigma-70 factor, ECF subfamily
MSGQTRADEFIRLFSAHEVRLRGYILCLLPRWSDAEEVAQQVSLVLWKKFDQFRPGTSFFAWACEVARLEVKSFRKRQARERLLFSDDLIEAVARETTGMQSELLGRLRALQRCVEKLAPKYRDILRTRYEEGGSVERVAKVFNRSMDSAYKALSRIRQALHECIDRTFAAGDL